MGQKGGQDWVRDQLPLGTVRVRQTGKSGSKVRVIKVRMDGPKDRRWIHLARHWWIHNRGPVPAGLRVAHLDGNTLNDAPGNYGLVSPGDVAYIWHDANPEGSRRNYEKCRAATIRCNQERAAVRRTLEYLTSCWYPVDHERRLVLNRPRRKRWQIYHDCGLSCNDRRAVRPESLGWPGVPLIQACVLHVLAGAPRGLCLADVRRHVGELRERRQWGQCAVTLATFYNALSELRRRGWVLTFRSRRKVYRIAQAAIDSRGPVPAYVPVRGVELAAPAYAGYRKLGLEESSC